ncbi:MAG: radical SAM protein, partial [Deltaproteobacteria bacterium HGW-Deltaproteobacteria-20]
MTDVVLVGIETEENLAIRYLAAACERAGLRTTLVTAREHGELEHLVANIVAQRPRVVGLAMTFQCYARSFLRFAARLRANGFDGHLTAGGHFATLAAERLLRDAPALDSIVMHEGEATLVELTQRLVDPNAQTLQSVRGLAVRDGGGSIVVTAPRALGPLDDLAPPVRADPAPRHLGIGHATLVGSRGCYGSCTYCSIQAWYRAASGPRFRQRSIDDIVSEMRSLYDRGVRIFNFHDDNFFVPSRDNNLARLDALIAALRNAGMADAAVVIKCRPNDIDGPILDRLETMR